MSDYITKIKDGVILRVIVHPRANKNAIIGVYRDMLKVQVTAPPLGNSANEMLIELLASSLKIPKSQISITVGKSSRQKILKISSVKFEKVKSMLDEIISPSKKIIKDNDLNLGLE
ncbi:MAG: DUF167 domain-containing protein [Deltaproteobacteria bacterium]|nr:DUF167 domain-containing protein [Deltaproteobacteria bacterium]